MCHMLSLCGDLSSQPQASTANNTFGALHLLELWVTGRITQELPAFNYSPNFARRAKASNYVPVADTGDYL